jgi:transcription-repair coupling factor (superfamily II helicase)
MAIDLLKMLAVRNSIHRKPYTPDGAQFASLVARFPYKETPDQTLCFQVPTSPLPSPTPLSYAYH